MSDKLLDPRFDAFCRWAATWPMARARAGLPGTQREFALSIEVTEQTLCNWKKRPEYQQLVRSYIDEYAVAARPVIIGALIESASLLGREGYQDRRLYLQMQEASGDSQENLEEKKTEEDREQLIKVRRMTRVELREAALDEFQKEHPEKSRAELEVLYQKKFEEALAKRIEEMAMKDVVEKARVRVQYGYRPGPGLAPEKMNNQAQHK